MNRMRESQQDALPTPPNDFRVVFLAWLQVRVTGFQLQVKAFAGGLAGVVFDLDFHVESPIADSELASDLSRQRNRGDDIPHQRPPFALVIEDARGLFLRSQIHCCASGVRHNSVIPVDRRSLAWAATPVEDF